MIRKQDYLVRRQIPEALWGRDLTARKKTARNTKDRGSAWRSGKETCDENLIGSEPEWLKNSEQRLDTHDRRLASRAKYWIKSISSSFLITQTVLVSTTLYYFVAGLRRHGKLSLPLIWLPMIYVQYNTRQNVPNAETTFLRNGNSIAWSAISWARWAENCVKGSIQAFFFSSFCSRPSGPFLLELEFRCHAQSADREGQLGIAYFSALNIGGHCCCI